MATVLIIDDNPDVGKALSLLLDLQGIDSLVAESPAEGLESLQAGSVDLVIQDMNFREDTTSGKEGIRLFEDIRKLDSGMPVILLTAWTRLDTAVELMKAGAADYLGKPWDDDKLLVSVKNLLEVRALRQENRRLKNHRHERREKLARQFDLCGTVYESDAMHSVLTLATQVAHAEVPVLITGANGTGKDKVAQVIQANSSCREGPFVTVNMGALPRDLMEAELFGATAGAFTGAQKNRIGRFEAADGGTIFLDEIGNLSLEGQMKLLRVLQTGEFERLGSSRTQRAKVRVISATNSDLKESIKTGEFREDLYYRLNVIQIDVPPLAERRDDILPLANYFLGSGHRLSGGARRALSAYSWPGNIRELQNMISRARLLASSPEISATDLGLGPDEANPEAEPAPDKNAIEAAINQAKGNISEAARLVGMSRQSLYRRMSKFGLKL